MIDNSLARLPSFAFYQPFDWLYKLFFRWTISFHLSISATFFALLVFAVQFYQELRRCTFVPRARAILTSSTI
jgi:hypothetical protein